MELFGEDMGKEIRVAAIKPFDKRVDRMLGFYLSDVKGAPQGMKGEVQRMILY